MSDVLIRDVPDEVLAAIDARAALLGLSRSEFLRRRLAEDVGGAGGRITVEDLQAFGREYGDLADDQVIARAWE